MQSINIQHFSSLIAKLTTASQALPNEAELIQKVAEIVLEELKESPWATYPPLQVDPKIGYVSYLIYECADHALAIELQSWLPGNKTLIHDHGTWGVVTVLSGQTNNRLWQRTDDGKRKNYARIEETHNVFCSPGTVLCMSRKAIHSLHNQGSEPTLELHIYGKNPNYTSRLAFNPLTDEALPYRIEQMT